MNEAIKTLRTFFKSDEWTQACADEQPIVKLGEMIYSGDVGLDTTVNLALDFEGYFNDMAHKYMQWRKAQGLSITD